MKDNEAIQKPVAWLWECISGPYKGEIDVHSLTGANDAEANRVSSIYSAPYPVYRSPMTVSDAMVDSAGKAFLSIVNDAPSLRHSFDEGMRAALTAALAPAEQEGEKVGQFIAKPNPFQSLEDQLYAEGDAKAAPTHPGGDSREVVERLREYAKDWRTRAASADVVDEAADIIEAVERELSDWQNGHANSVRAHAAAITRAETAEASLAAAREALRRAEDEFGLIIMRLDDKQPERAKGAAMCGEKDARAALAGSNGE